MDFHVKQIHKTKYPRNKEIRQQFIYCIEGEPPWIYKFSKLCVLQNPEKLIRRFMNKTTKAHSHLFTRNVCDFLTRAVRLFFVVVERVITISRTRRPTPALWPATRMKTRMVRTPPSVYLFLWLNFFTLLILMQGTQVTTSELDFMKHTFSCIMVIYKKCILV